MSFIVQASQIPIGSGSDYRRWSVFLRSGFSNLFHKAPVNIFRLRDAHVDFSLIWSLNGRETSGKMWKMEGRVRDTSMIGTISRDGTKNNMLKIADEILIRTAIMKGSEREQ